jgi:DNA modification methylase
MSTSTLTRPQIRQQLRQLEDVIQTAQRWQMEAAKALLTIRERKLFSATHETFEAYALERWGYERAYSYRLCQWAEVAGNLSTIGDFPKTESHARPLFGLSPDQQKSAWKQVERRLGGQKTAAEIESVVKDYLTPNRAKKAPTITRTCSGEVVCGDALVKVNELAPGSVGLVLFSPPYCEQRKGKYPGIPEHEFPQWLTRLMTNLQPALTPDASVLIVGREHVRGGMITDCWLRARLMIREGGFKEIETLIWHKNDAPPLGRNDRPRRAYEYVYWFSPTSNPYIDTRACGTPLVESRGRMGRDRGKDVGTHGRQIFGRFRTTDLARVTDVIAAPVGGGMPANIPHPAMYPLRLADQLIKTFSREGDVVADPCCGSGQTLIAARDSGRNWWGCDIVPRFAKLSRERIADS